jgi:hypothetical protein
MSKAPVFRCACGELLSDELLADGRIVSVCLRCVPGLRLVDVVGQLFSRSVSGST